MNTRAGHYKQNLSGEMAYQSFVPSPLPPNPPIDMTEDLIKEVKHIQQCLINVDMEGEDWEEKMEAVHKLEDVATYLKDALGKGIEF